MRIVVVGAHLDDIELACGGTLTRAAANGNQIKMLVMSDSAYKNYRGEVMRTREEALDEGIEAAKILGVSDLEVLGFPNKDIPFNSAVVEAIEARLDDFQPDLIFTHFPFDTHQDHKNVGQATIAAARKRNSILLYEPLAPSGRSQVAFRPQIYVDISGFMKQKLAALRAHISQHKKYGDLWLEAVAARARHRGYEMGKNYAETFEVLRFELQL